MMAGATETFDMGRVFSGMARSIVDHWMVILGFAVLAAVVTSVATGLVMSSLLTPDFATNPSAVFVWLLSPSYWGLLIITAAVSSFAQTGILSALYKGVGSGDASFADALASAVARFIPYFFLTMLWSLAIGVGFVLLIVPGVFLMTMWAVSAPALAGEGRGLFDAFSRSQQLTKGNRWWVLLTLLIFGILSGFLSFAAQGFSSTGMMALYQSSLVAAIVVGVILQTVQMTILTSFLNSLYFELRRVNGQAGASGLQDIFA